MLKPVCQQFPSHQQPFFISRNRLVDRLRKAPDPSLAHTRGIGGGRGGLVSKRFNDRVERDHIAPTEDQFAGQGQGPPQIRLDQPPPDLLLFFFGMWGGLSVRVASTCASETETRLPIFF